MSHRRDIDEEWEDDSYFDDQNESAEDEGAEADNQEATIPCPYCQRAIHKESEHCPYCERYISEEDAPPSRKPWWIIVGVVAGLYAVYLWITRR
jgi:hypothetical protein